MPSKKLRAPVEYTPATVEEYKQRFGAKGEYTELGHLGPDLDDERVLMKRALQEKVKHFSRELHRVNRQRATAAAVVGSAKPPMPKPEPKPTSRAKALEFAKNVPKPKAIVRQLEGLPKAPPSPKLSEEAEAERADWDEIRQREKQHFEDLARVAQIKDFVNQLQF